MATQVYKTLAKIVGAALLIIGVALVAGGLYAHSFVRQQLADQMITMPAEQAIDAQLQSGRIAEEDAEALRPHAGEMMTTGPQAEAFADHYIRAHMRAGAQAAGIPDEQASYSGIGALVTEKTNAFKEELAADPANANLSPDEITALAEQEIADPATDYPAAQEIAALQDLRMGTFLDGNTLRGMLLNAYGWWLIGTIAQVAGGVLIVVGIGLLILGFTLKPKTAPGEPTGGSPVRASEGAVRAG